MDVTKRLIDLNPDFVLHNEGHWSEPYDPNMPGFTSFNDAGIETETGEFLYALTRLLKPNHVLETGTHFGVGASYIGQALADNKAGGLTTIEFLQEIKAVADRNLTALRLHTAVGGPVETLLMDVAKFDPGETMYKLIFLDTEPQTRFAELIKFYEHLEPGGFVFIHDLHQHMHQIANEEHGFAWPYGKLPVEINNLVAYGHLRPFHFATPRGLTGFYKVHPNDYKF